MEVKQEMANLGDPAFKSQLAFGQVPYLEHGDLKLAQSNAILRYLVMNLRLLCFIDSSVPVIFHDRVASLVSKELLMLNLLFLKC